MKSKFIALLLIAVIMGSHLIGCEDGSSTTISSTPTATNATTAVPDVKSNFNEKGYPIVNETITINAMNTLDVNGKPWGEDLAFLREMKKLTNISFKYSNTPLTEWVTKMNISLASNDLPDVYMSPVGQDNIVNYGVKGRLFVDFSDKIEKYMPLMLSWKEKYPLLIKAVTQSDGGVYSLPRVAMTATVSRGNMYVRTDFMKAAGFAKDPETIDEFYTMLKAIQSKYPESKGYITLLPYGSAAMSEHFEEFLLPAFGDYVTSGFEADLKGKVLFNADTEQFYRYLEFAHLLFSEKIIPNEIYTMDTNTALALLKKGNVAATTYGTQYSMDAFPSGSYDVSLLGPMTSKYTDVKKMVAPSALTNSERVITTKCKNVEALLRWYDTYYSVEDVAPGLNGVSAWMGIRGENWDFTDNTKRFFTRFQPEGMNASVYVGTVSTIDYLALDFMAIQTGSSPGQEIKGLHAIAKVYPYSVDRFPLSFLRYTDAERDRYTTIMTDINTYVSQMKAKFITGQEPLSKYEDYVNNLNKMGLAKAIEIVQTAYDRFIQD